MTNCNCKEITHIEGNEGSKYAESHLKVLKVDSSEFTTLYQCPETGILWKESYPNINFQGGGSPEFNQINENRAKSEFNYTK